MENLKIFKRKTKEKKEVHYKYTPYKIFFIVAQGSVQHQSKVLVCSYINKVLSRLESVIQKFGNCLYFLRRSADLPPLPHRTLQRKTRKTGTLQCKKRVQMSNISDVKNVNKGKTIAHQHIITKSKPLKLCKKGLSKIRFRCSDVNKGSTDLLPETL